MDLITFDYTHTVYTYSTSSEPSTFDCLLWQPLGLPGHKVVTTCDSWPFQQTLCSPSHRHLRMERCRMAGLEQEPRLMMYGAVVVDFCFLCYIASSAAQNLQAHGEKAKCSTVLLECSSTEAPKSLASCSFLCLDCHFRSILVVLPAAARIVQFRRQVPAASGATSECSP